MARISIGQSFSKSLMLGFALVSLTILSACSTNPATGKQQFTALMSPEKENQIGAQEHKNIIKTYGVIEASNPIAQYVTRVGQTVAKNTERPDVQYKFYVLDDPIVNAFALPGGYVYISRGLLAQANSEAELASVLGHEIGHITGRHSAERYSRGVVTTLGASILAAASGSQSAAQAASIGSDLFLKSYSRGQEHEADDLGTRYIFQAGYEPTASASFLQSLQAHTNLENKIAGRSGSGFSYFSTHPQTGDRIQRAMADARKYPENQSIVRRDDYLRVIDGLTYGHSAKQGFERDGMFYHPVLGFTFNVPNDFVVRNKPSSVIGTSPKTGATFIFDGVANKTELAPETFISDVWMKKEPIQGLERINVNGMRGATGTFTGSINGTSTNIRLVAIEWDKDTIYRFQIAMPRNVTVQEKEGLQRLTYSLRRMTSSEKSSIKPYRLGIVTAKAGDTVVSLSNMMAMDKFKQERFRSINALSAREQVVGGRLYKVVR